MELIWVLEGGINERRMLDSSAAREAISAVGMAVGAAGGVAVVAGCCSAASVIVSGAITVTVSVKRATIERIGVTFATSAIARIQLSARSRKPPDRRQVRAHDSRSDQDC